MNLPRCACGFVMPGPLHGKDCKLYNPAVIYKRTPEDRLKEVEAELLQKEKRIKALEDFIGIDTRTQCDHTRVDHSSGEPHWFRCTHRRGHLGPCRFEKEG